MNWRRQLTNAAIQAGSIGNKSMRAASGNPMAALAATMDPTLRAQVMRSGKRRLGVGASILGMGMMGRSSGAMGSPYSQSSGGNTLYY